MSQTATPCQHGPQVLGSMMVGLVGAHAITLVLGIAFWAVAARTAVVSEVGIAALLIATTSSLASLTNLAAGVVLERFLPRATSRRRAVLMTAHGLTSSMTAVAALIFVWIDPVPRLLAGPGSASLFVALAMLTSLFALLDSVLIGLGANTWVMAKNVAHGALKLALLAGLGWSSASTSAPMIVLAWLIPTVAVSAVVVILVCAGRTPWQRDPRTSSEWLPTRRDLISFWAPNFGWLLAGAVPGFVVPVIVGREMSLDQAAYFATAWMLMTASNAVVMVATSPYVAAATRAPEQVASLTRTFAITMGVLNLGRALGLAVAGPLILGLYGDSYRLNGSSFLWTIAIVHAASAPAYVYGGLARLYRRVTHPMLVQVFASTTVVAAALLLVPRHGVMGVAFAYLIQEVVVLALATPWLAKLWRSARSGLAP